MHQDDNHVYAPAPVYGGDTRYPSTGTPVDLKPLPTPIEPGTELEQMMNLDEHEFLSWEGVMGEPSSNSPNQWRIGGEETYQSDVISVSTSFPPNSDPAPDTIFASNDNVYFYTSYHNILKAAPHAFGPCLIAPLYDPHYRTTVVVLGLPSGELNIILHALHKTSPADNAPPFEMLVRAIDRMPSLGLSAEHLITPHTPLYTLLLAHAPRYPLDSYALAAHHRIVPLAETVSSHLLSHNFSTLSDEMAERIGPVYLKRMLLLHSDRFAALKDILVRAPMPHPETDTCSFEDQKKLTRAWALVSAYLVWDAKPDTSTHALGNALNPLLQHLTCIECIYLLKSKIKDVMVRWTAVKRTI